MLYTWIFLSVTALGCLALGWVIGRSSVTPLLQRVQSLARRQKSFLEENAATLSSVQTFLVNTGDIIQEHKTADLPPQLERLDYDLKQCLYFLALGSVAWEKSPSTSVMLEAKSGLVLGATRQLTLQLDMEIQDLLGKVWWDVIKDGHSQSVAFQAQLRAVRKNGYDGFAFDNEVGDVHIRWRSILSSTFVNRPIIVLYGDIG